MASNADEKAEELAQSYKKLIDNELAKSEEEKAEREKWMRENQSRPKVYSMQIHETPDNLIKVLELLKGLKRN